MKKHILFFSAVALFLSSCEIFSSLSEKTGAISIKMPEGSERIAETYDVNEITSFTAELYDSGSSPVTKVSSTPGKSITLESLTPGSYAIVIKAFISAECAAYAEKSGIVVEAGATTYETITLFKNIIKNIESVEIAKESLDKITKNYTVGQTFALPDNVSIIAHFIHGYEKELEPDDYEIYICNAEQFAESSLVKDLTLSAKARFAAVGICTESGNKYSAPVSLVMNAEEPVVTWTIPAVNDNAISFELSAKASGEISYIWEKAKTADMAGKTACTSEINMPEDGTVALPLKDDSGADVYYVCTVTNTNSAVNGTTTASRQTAVFSSQMENFTVTFNLNYDGSTITTQDVASGSAVEKPEVPTRDGYTFAGWYTDADCSTEYNFKASVTGNITLYAKWTVEVITDWDTLSVKLNSGTDVGNIYVSGEFDVTSTISFSGTANIISTGTGVTFSRKKGYASDFFSLYSASLTFKGSESAPIVFDGTFETQTSNLITNGGTTTFEYCSFKNNSSSTFASVYLLDNYDSSNTTFRFCSFTGNKGPKGGAVYVGDGDKVCFENCRFENNTSSSDGGAVYIKASATATFSDCTFNNNEASSCGGAVYIKAEATGTFSNCTFKSNTASYYGGAVYIESTGTGSFSDCTFEGNSANTHGGAIDSSGTADITNCTFTSNKTTNTTGYGGAINIDSGTVDISSITCSGNSATTGKDIYHSNGTLNIGGTVDGSIDIYMYNNSSSPVLVPQQGITLASVTDTINVTMTKCSEGTTVLTQSDGMTTSDFAAAINCFTLTNNGFVIGSDGKAVTE
ncbi:right-handed parallel beta-helix repeat-containing protein [Treponema porcinum]|uniref:right-handed parallel beta-helix repeat-containing protein n=1 Tax=Treponema porcinum TaxID=261392 RepID=UPI0023569AF6|nr:InlB B-repeat-containing protein [Treponema porcinum]MCI6323123.1 InlB B-repeat-containing protein [Treponema porcinum]